MAHTAHTAALFDAACKRDMARVLAALRDGAEINARDSNGHTPLMIATYNSRDPSWPLDNPELDATVASIAGALIAAGAEVNAAGPEGETALVRAVMMRRADAVSVLLAAGADDHATCEGALGMSARELAQHEGHEATLEAFGRLDLKRELQATLRAGAEAPEPRRRARAL